MTTASTATLEWWVILLNDLMDAQALSVRLGDRAAQALLAEHDHGLRELAEQHRGREIDKSDGFLLLFPDAERALAFATAYHELCARWGLSARVGMHWGEVALRANSADEVARGAKRMEVEGVAKPIAARVMSMAVGGQTLVTADLARALESAPDPSGQRLVLSHGHWRLQGVAEPLEVFEVGRVGRAPMVPPRGSAKTKAVKRLADGSWTGSGGTSPKRIPPERDAYLGRESEGASLWRAFDEGKRLVCVLGIGGVGKTRFAIHYANTWGGTYEGGAYFCDLAEVRTLEGVVEAVGRALKVDDIGASAERIGAVLAERGPCLLVLDTMEHLVRFSAQTIGIWRTLAPEAHFIVTSREVLGCADEVALALAPLPVDVGAALFSVRCEAARGRAMGPDEAAVVVELARVLDGLPLAIELAAARGRVLPPHELLRRMADRFQLLSSTGPRRDRHATLRAALDGSWESLSGAERLALGRASVFEGGFDREAVAAMIDPATLAVLVSRSLLRQDSGGRLDMLLTVQEYVRGAVDAATIKDAELHHGLWFASLGKSVSIDALRGPKGALRAGVLALDRRNVDLAIRRAMERGDHEVAARVALAAAEVFGCVGPLAVAFDAIAIVGADRKGVSARTWARLRVASGRLLLLAGRLSEAASVLEEVVAHSTDLDPRARLEALNEVAACQLALGDERALNATLALASTLVHGAYAPLVRSGIALREVDGLLKVGDAAGALLVCGRALHVLVPEGAGPLSGEFQLELARAHAALGDDASATVALADALVHLDGARSVEGFGRAHAVIAALALRRGDSRAAEEALARATAIAERLGVGPEARLSRVIRAARAAASDDGWGLR